MVGGGEGAGGDLLIGKVEKGKANGAVGLERVGQEKGVKERSCWGMGVGCGFCLVWGGEGGSGRGVG